MAKLDLALIVRTVDKATAPLRRIQQTVRQVGRSTGLDRVGRRAGAVGRQLRIVGRETIAFGKRIGLFVGAVGTAVGGYAITASAQMETLKTSFESMLGGAEKARAMVKRLSEFAAKTPFQLLDIGKATKALLAFGEDSKTMTGTLSTLGDIAAGAGVPLNELAQIYGKTMAKGKAQTEELNQLSERGVPIVEALVELAARYGNTMSKADVYKAAERGQISFKALREAMQLLTEEGGIFHEQMARQSKTTQGIFSTLKDNVFNIMGGIGDQMIEGLSVKQGMKDLIKWLQDFQKETDNFKAVGDSLRKMRKGFGEAVAAGRAFMDGLRETFPVVGDAIGRFTKWADEIGWLTIALGAVTFLLGRTLIGAILRLIFPLFGLTFAIGRAAFGLAFLAGKVALGLGRLIVAGVMRPIASVRRAFGAAGRGLAVLGRAVVSGLGLLGVAGVLRPIAAVRRVFGATGRGLAALGRAVVAGLGLLGIAGVTRPIAAVRRVFGATGRGLGVLGRAVVAGLGALGVAGVIRPLAAVRAGFRSTDTARKDFRAEVKQGTGRLNIGGVTGPLRGIGRVMGTMTRLVGRLALGFLGGPIGWLITGALLLWEFWDPIKGWWDGLWKGLKKAWNDATWIADIGKAFSDEIAYITTKFETFRAYLEDFSAYLEDFFEEGPGGAPGRIAGRNAGQIGLAGEPAPSLFEPPAGSTEDSPGGARGRLGRSGKASVTVDFRNMPRGTRTETRADSDTDLEVTTGYAMQGAQ